MLRIRPLAAALNPLEQVAAAVARAGERLQARGVAHRFATGDDEAADALLVVTGGSEHLALAAAERIAGPVFVLAHGGLNSLPAALEILAALRQRGRPGRILPLEDEDPALPRLAHHIEVRRSLHAARRPPGWWRARRRRSWCARRGDRRWLTSRSRRCSPR